MNKHGEAGSLQNLQDIIWLKIKRSISAPKEQHKLSDKASAQASAGSEAPGGRLRAESTSAQSGPVGGCLGVEGPGQVGVHSDPSTDASQGHREDSRDCAPLRQEQVWLVWWEDCGGQ